MLSDERHEPKDGEEPPKEDVSPSEEEVDVQSTLDSSIQQRPTPDKTPPAADDVDAMATEIMQRFTDGEFDAVRVVYMRFISNARQVPEVLQKSRSRELQVS